MIFTNSADQLRAALDRSIDKEMAIEALSQSRDRNFLSRQEWEGSLGPTAKEAAEQAFDQGSSREGRNSNEQAAGEEMELDLSS